MIFFAEKVIIKKTKADRANGGFLKGSYMEESIMKSVQISLQMASQVKAFVSIVQKYSYEIDLRSDRYVVDAKSILGIFSLDLTKPLSVEIHSDNCDDLVAELKQFET